MLYTACLQSWSLYSAPPSQNLPLYDNQIHLLRLLRQQLRQMDGGEPRTPTNAQPSLPGELIFEILLRVPVKSLLKFKCVSKFWLSLISSPQFIKAHLEESENNAELSHHMIITHYLDPKFTMMQCSVKSLLQEPITYAAGIDYPVENHPRSSYYVGSCNGLICIFLNDKDLYLWNPCTRKSKQLADSGYTKTIHWFCIFGFGYNELHDDYNVVMLLNIPDGLNFEVKVYSLKTDSWRRVENFPARFPASLTGTFVNGKICLSAFNSTWDRGIVSLDLAQTKYEHLNFPDGVEEARDLRLANLDKCLCARGVYGDHLDFWVMKEYGVVESWVKVFRIQHFDIPLCISGKGETLLKCSSNFGLYDSRDGSLRYPRIQNMNKLYRNADVYVESLVSPIANYIAGRLHDQQRQEW